VVEVLHELLTTQRVLRRMLTMTTRHHRVISRSIRVLLEINVMALLVINPEAAGGVTMRCDEGFNA
jgi:hypothetical protein